LSATRDDKNQWQIDPAELFRVYPPNTDTEHQETPQTHSKIELLEEKIRHQACEMRRLEQIADDLRADREDLRSDRDHWRRQATHLLTYQPQAAPPPAAPEIEAPAPMPEPVAPKRGLFEKLFGRRKAGE